jgi:hypothetical protein
VLIVVVVLSLLGFALMNYSIADTIQVARDEHKMQAQYLARSGAHSVTNYLIKNGAAVHDLLGRESSAVALGDGTFTVKVWGHPDTTVFVESTGTVRDVSQTVLVELRRSEKIDAALAAIGITLEGSCLIDGDIAYDSDYNAYGAVTVTGDIQQQDFIFPDADFPSCADLTLIPYDTLVLERPNLNPTIRVDSCTNRVRLNNKHDVLTIVLGAVDQETRILLVDEFDSSGGTIQLDGKGVFMLYVRDSFILNGNFLSTDAGESFTIVFLAPGATFIQSGTTNFEGIIYAPSSTFVTSGGGSSGANILGSVIAENIGGDGNIRVTYKAFTDGFLPIDILGIKKWRYQF